MTSTRRGFLISGAALGGAAMAGFPAHAQTTVTGVTYLPTSYKALSYGSSGFVEELKKSDAVNVDWYDSGKLVTADEQLPALRSGSIDFMFHTTSYITRSVPILGITGMPGVVEALYENPDRIKRGSPLFELINEQLAEDGLYMLSLMGGILEPEYVWSSDKGKITSVADIEGKKIRVVSFEATQVLEGWGAATVRIPSSELYLGLQRGTVDAAVANISTVIGRSLQETVNTVYKLPMTAFGIGLFTTTRRWDAMGDGEKEAFTTAAEWLDENGAREANDVIYPDEFWPTIDEAGIEVIDPSEEDIAKLEEAAKSVEEKWIEEVGDAGQRAIDLALGNTSS